MTSMAIGFDKLPWKEECEIEQFDTAMFFLNALFYFSENKMDRVKLSKSDICGYFNLAQEARNNDRFEGLLTDFLETEYGKQYKLAHEDGLSSKFATAIEFIRDSKPREAVTTRFVVITGEEFSALLRIKHQNLADCFLLLCCIKSHMFTYSCPTNNELKQYGGWVTQYTLCKETGLSDNRCEKLRKAILDNCILYTKQERNDTFGNYYATADEQWIWEAMRDRRLGYSVRNAKIMNSVIKGGRTKFKPKY